jgi:hypothetical protein
MNLTSALVVSKGISRMGFHFKIKTPDDFCCGKAIATLGW